jgi:leucyl-tRNA---protein transferase
MKVFKSEFNNNYHTYSFGYTEYAIIESVDDFESAYSGGYLPYSADLSIDIPVFYLARSLRVNTEQFSDSSENRRVDRKVSLLNPQIEKLEINDKLLNDKVLFNFCLNYAEERFSDKAVNQDRLKYIFNLGIATHIFRFSIEGHKDNFGYILTAIYENSLHYWFSFYNTEFLKDAPLGKWLMWRMIKWSKENGIKYIYLGTVYNEKALYKVRDFNGLEFFDGISWNKNVELLKEKCKTDKIPKEKDDFKNSVDNMSTITRILKLEN